MSGTKNKLADLFTHENNAELVATDLKTTAKPAAKTKKAAKKKKAR